VRVGWGCGSGGGGVGVGATHQPHALPHSPPSPPPPPPTPTPTPTPTPHPSPAQGVLARVGLNHGHGLSWMQRESTAEEQKEAGVRLAFLRRTDPFDRARVLL